MTLASPRASPTDRHFFYFFVLFLFVGLVLYFRFFRFYLSGSTRTVNATTFLRFARWFFVVGSIIFLTRPPSHFGNFSIFFCLSDWFFIFDFFVFTYRDRRERRRDDVLKIRATNFCSRFDNFSNSFTDTWVLFVLFWSHVVFDLFVYWPRRERWPRIMFLRFCGRFEKFSSSFTHSSGLFVFFFRLVVFVIFIH